MLIPLLKGILLGFSIAAPVGPIGILCIRRTVTLGRLHGFLSGLGAASADAFYGFIAGFGLTLITNFLLDQRTLLQAVGGLFLLYLGIQTYRSDPAKDPAKAKGETLFRSYASTFMLTITNPLTIMSFLGAFAGLGLGGSQAGIPSAAALVAGVFIGSALWWLALSLIVGILRERLNVGALKWVNRVSGAIVTIFGVIALLGLLQNDQNIGKEIEADLHKIITDKSSMASSNPGQYIANNQESYDRIVRHGDAAIVYLTKELKASNRNGLKEWIMAKACADILQENNPVEEWETGKQWLTKYEQSN
ncbi:LysE family translocator [Paenibacillus sedimenti]|uniref:LysE family translocator n=1 Tax=Paenibacillus sedimenti TaxID=2770274 RepID=A0A926KUJ9_9BACL|nr:LysE family translocator [Paenibacillus sedimenti]MBD0382508.1 LysE family translocator [Paenibacillus sedimenti]